MEPINNSEKVWASPARRTKIPKLLESPLYISGYRRWMVEGSVGEGGGGDLLMCDSGCSDHGLINFNYIDMKAKCRHLTKLTWKGALRQVFIKVYRLEIHSVMLVFSNQLCELLPLYPSLWLNSPPLSPSPFPM